MAGNNLFTVTQDAISLRDSNGATLTARNVTKDEAHKLLLDLERVFGRPETLTQEEILQPEKVSFLLDGSGDLGNE